MVEADAAATGTIPPEDVPRTLSLPLVFWLDGAKVAGSPAAKVSSWPDRGPRGNDFVQSVLDEQPTVGASGGVHFEVGQTLWLNDRLSARPAAISSFVVCRSFTSAKPIMGFPYPGADRDSLEYPFWRWNFYRDFADRLEFRLSEENYTSAFARGWSWGEFAAYAFRSAERSVFRNGNMVLSVHTSVPPPSIKYSASPSGGVLLGDFKGDILEVILYDGTVRDDEALAIGNYLRAKWSL